jgi:hypothetical protein
MESQRNTKPHDKMNKIEIGTKVERIASDYTNGRKGEVIEINGERARVRWGNSPRTWVNFKFLKVLAAAAVVKGDWVQTPNSKSHTAYRVCENKAEGLVWHEYQGKRKMVKGQWQAA